MEPRGALWIGTSGWHYPHWVGPFYPPGLRAAQFLEYYAARFRSVEINNSFYQLPSAADLRRWNSIVPAGFIFAVKASRYITHMKKLKDPDVTCEKFFDRIAALEETLGPVLFQLPPRWRVDTERLAAFLEALPGGLRYAFEFRDPSWFNAEVEALLQRHGAAVCVFDLEGFLSPRLVTADFVYVRLHGPAGCYQGTYKTKVLAEWARQIEAWRGSGRDVYCYFDNDEAGYAVRDARRLADMADGVARPPTEIG